MRLIRDDVVRMMVRMSDRRSAPVIVWTSVGPAVQWLDLAVCRAPTAPMPQIMIDQIIAEDREISSREGKK